MTRIFTILAVLFAIITQESVTYAASGIETDNLKKDSKIWEKSSGTCKK